MIWKFTETYINLNSHLLQNFALINASNLIQAIASIGKILEGRIFGQTLEVGMPRICSKLLL